jgi:hypothetical protein
VGLAHTTAAATAGNASELRMNQIQVVGTHNSYHREISYAERTVFEKFVPGFQNLYYSHAKWADQFDHQAVRSGEIDLHSDTVGGLYAQPLIWKLSNLTNETIPWHDDNMLKPGLKVSDEEIFNPRRVSADCAYPIASWQGLPVLGLRWSIRMQDHRFTFVDIFTDAICRFST